MEDKIAELAVVTVLNQIYEEDWDSATDSDQGKASIGLWTQSI